MGLENALKLFGNTPKRELNADFRDLRNNPELGASKQSYAIAGQYRKLSFLNFQVFFVLYYFILGSNDVSVFSSTKPSLTSTPKENTTPKLLLSSVKTSYQSLLGALPRDYPQDDNVSLNNLISEMEGFKSGRISSSASVWILNDPVSSPLPFTQLKQTKSTSMW